MSYCDRVGDGLPDIPTLPLRGVTFGVKSNQKRGGCDSPTPCCGDAWQYDGCTITGWKLRFTPKRGICTILPYIQQRYCMQSACNAHWYYEYIGKYIFIIRRGAAPSPLHLSGVGDDAHIVPFNNSQNLNLSIS